MASAFAHAVAAASLGQLLGPPCLHRRWLFLGMVCAILPDADVIGFSLGIPYQYPFGHRGLTHSLAFALLVSLTIAVCLFREVSGTVRLRLLLSYFLATASHGLLDAMTDGGLGVAFFWPFSNDRYLLPSRPIMVSPIEPRRFFTPEAWAILSSELLWVGVPAGALAMVEWWRHRRNVDF